LLIGAIIAYRSSVPRASAPGDEIVDEARHQRLRARRGLQHLLVTERLGRDARREVGDERDARHLDAAGVRDVISAVMITGDKLIQANDFKVSRKKIATLYAEGRFTLLDSSGSSQQMLEALAIKIRDAFASALMLDADGISDEADFFTELGGSSLDYFTLIDILKEELGVELSELQQSNLTSVKAFYEYLKK